MEKIQDDTVAQALMERVNEFNIATGLKSVGFCVLFCSLPSTTAFSLLTAGGILGALYVVGLLRE